MEIADIEKQLIEKGNIPFDKSWIIRMGILDLLNNQDDIFKFLLEKRDELSEDLQALHRAIKAWKAEGQDINVGESATLYRFLKFASWKLKKNKKFILQGTLGARKICDDPNIINYPLKDLLQIDNGTSQWASAAVLLGNREVAVDPPFKLVLTYEAVAHWEKQRVEGLCWEPRYDETILRQAVTFIKLLRREKVSFTAQQAEDYFFASMFGFKTREWHSLRGHESDRISEMKKIKKAIKRGKPIVSKDHRAVQAAAMYQKLHGKPYKILYPSAVYKSCPQFWRFMNDSPSFLEK